MIQGRLLVLLRVVSVLGSCLLEEVWVSKHEGISLVLHVQDLLGIGDLMI